MQAGEAAEQRPGIATVSRDPEEHVVFLGEAVYTVAELTAALDRDCPQAARALSLVKPLGNMGLAALPTGAPPRYSAEQHAAFLAKWELTEAGDPATARRRS
ncbi:MAG TPA: hypothetical protein VJR06_02930 [Nitrososphaerales archaeon]|nr:hypothetical protein [Nitrososphaerales archaeon]